MNSEKVQRWIDALRSGKYEQGKCELRQDNLNSSQDEPKYSYCCLGVACDLEPKYEWGNKFAVAKEDEKFISTTHPPDWINEELGLSKSLKDVDDELLANFNASGVRNIASGLIFLNDSMGWDFNQIADWLETNLLPLAHEK